MLMPTTHPFRLAAGVAVLLSLSCTGRATGPSTVAATATRLAPAEVCATLPACATAAAGVACCVATPPAPAQLASASVAPGGLSDRTPLFTATAEVEYRIPSLLRMADGSLVAFAERRHGTVPSDADTGFIEVVYRVRSADGATWGVETTLCSAPPSETRPHGLTCGNTTSVYDRLNDRIVVMMNVNDGDVSLLAARNGMRVVRERDRRIVFAVSDPRAREAGEGIRFSDPLAESADLTEQLQPANYRWDAVGPGAGFQLSDGTLAFPAKGRNLFLSRDGEWRAVPLTGAGAEPPEGTLVQRNDGSLLRNDRAGGADLRRFRRQRSVSLDAGFATWTPYTQEGQPLTPGHYCDPSVCAPDADTCDAAFESPPHAGCGTSPTHVHAALGRYPGELPHRLFFTNPGNSQRRAGLQIRLSYDEGDTWPMARQIEGMGYTVGYSAAVALEERGEAGIGIAFEHSDAGRHSILFRRASLAFILCGRSEPVLIGGNAWMGTFDNAIRAEDGSVTYVGRSDAGEINVVSAVSALRTDAAEVTVVTDGFVGRAVVRPTEPGVFVTDAGLRFTMAAAAPILECGAAAPSATPPAAATPTAP